MPPEFQEKPSADELQQALSFERFGRYLEWAGDDRDAALSLYALNTALSEALYTPLQMLEVALRNGFHTQLSRLHGEMWFDTPGLLASQRHSDQVRATRRDLFREKKPETPGRLVAGLTFGFWTAFLNREYETLWRSTLHHAVRRPDGKSLSRKALAAPITQIRTLRNRIAHHEPILYWDLPRHYRLILEVTGWLSPAAAVWSAQRSRFAEVFPPHGITLRGGA